MSVNANTKNPFKVGDVVKAIRGDGSKSPNAYIVGHHYVVTAVNGADVHTKGITVPGASNGWFYHVFKLVTQRKLPEWF
jgi:hypothetical protein